MKALKVEPTGANDYGPCACCGNCSRGVWGFVHTAEASIASYFVQWTPSQVADYGANFDLIIGRWGEGTSARDRVLVALAFRLLETGPGFMVIDAAGRSGASSELVGRALARAEVVGLPVATQAFAIVDAVLAQDARIAELLRA